MYNRYIPQPDGSYRRSNQPDRAQSHGQASQPRQQKTQSPSHKQEEAPPCSPEKEEPRQERQEHPKPHREPQGQSITQFLRQLLPKDFDTADLLIVLLLILMAGDSQEDQNNALLTLALYLFM